MKKPKTTKILFLLHLPPPVHGSSMVGKWIKDSSIINTSFSSVFINLLASKKVKESGKVTLGKILGMLLVCYELIIKLIKERPNLCYIALTTTGAAFYRDALLVSILKLFKVRRVYHLHNKGVAKASKNKLNHLIYNFVFKNASIILLSQHLYKDIEKFVDKQNIFICPNGIPDLKNQLSSHQSKANKVPVVLFLSNLIESKGVYVLLNALSNIKRKNIPFKAVFVGGEGDISVNSFNHKVESLNLIHEVEYLGKKFNQEKADIFKKADIFAFPTYYSNECFPLVLLEAMQYALPVISTFEGGIQDIIRDGQNGFLVEQKNVAKLAKKITELLLNNHLSVSMGKNGKEMFDEKYTLSRFEQNLNQILKQIAIK